MERQTDRQSTHKHTDIRHAAGQIVGLGVLNENLAHLVKRLKFTISGLIKGKVDNNGCVGQKLKIFRLHSC